MGWGGCVVVLLLMWALLAAPAQAAAAEDTPTVDSLVRVIDDSTLAVGNLRLAKRSREIVIPGWVNMQKGQIEYLATTPGGKTHETVLTLDCQPLHLQTALLLLGFDHGETTMRFQGDSTAPQGDSLAVTVRWKDADGHEVVHRADALIYDLPNETAMPATPWLFTGSMVIDGRFMADLDGSIIATYSDPAAVLNNPLSGRLDDTVYEANRKILPVPGTPVTVTVSAWTEVSTSRD